MKLDITEMLNEVLDYYFNIPYETAVKNIQIRVRIETIRNMKIIIYSNDHNPPHFHVKSNDNSINAKFLIEDCKFLSGSIGSKDLKRVEAFHRDLKTQILLKMIWDKRL